MEINWAILKKFIGMLLIVNAVIYICYIGFTNDNMTPQQLFVNYWLKYLVILFAALVGRILIIR